MPNEAAALAALAEPTRRKVFDRVRRRPWAVGELARALRVSQPAVSQHLGVLKRAGLVSVRPEGTRRLYRARTDGLAALRRWLDAMWDDVLAAYAAGEEEDT